MQIIDAQIHLWATGLPSNPTYWPVTHFTAEEAIAPMDEGGIDAAVIHPPDWDPGSTELALRAVKDHPGRFASMGSLPLEQPSSCARIAGWRQQPGMLGLRYSFLDDPARGWLADGSIDWLWAEAEKADVPIYMIATDSLADVGRIAERHSGLRLTIAHLGGRGGLTTLRDDAVMAHMPALLALAKYQNVAVAATGLPGYSTEPYPFPAMHTHLRRTHRCVWPPSRVLGDSHFRDALLMASMCDVVHRGTAVARRGSTRLTSR